VSALAAGLIGYNFLGTSKNASADAPPKAEAQKLDKRAFTGGDQGFIDLKLREAVDYNHNTKRFVFDLPESDQVSGMNVACKCPRHKSLFSVTCIHTDI
jgi:cytochrome-b5 reductase